MHVYVEAVHWIANRRYRPWAFWVEDGNSCADK